MASATSERAPRTMSSSNMMHARRSVPNMVLQSSPQSLQEGAVALPNVPHVVTLSGARVVLWDTAKRRAERLTPDHVQALVSLLVMGSDRQREDVAAILANAACDKTNSMEIARAGAIPMLITALTTANPAQPKPKTFVVKVTRALANLAWQNTANQLQIDASGGVGTLVEVLSGRAGDDSDVYEEAAKALSHLMDCSEVAMRVDVENSGEKLNELAQNGSETQCGLATTLLAKVACHTVKQEHVVALADVPALIKMLADSSSATTSDQSKRAAAVLRKLSHDVKYKSEIVVAGGLTPLIKLMTIGCEKERVDAAWTIGHLAWNAFSEAQIANAGAIPPLILLVQSENVREREAAVWALRHLSCTSDNRTRISALPEAIPSLVQCVRLAGSDCEREHAIATLKNLACHTENQSSIASAGAMPLLVSILTRGTQGQMNQATATLRNLVHKNPKNQAALFNAGGIRALVQLLTTGSDTQKINSAAALANVANTTENQCEIVAEGVLAPLLSLTESHHPALLEQVLLLLRNLIWQNEKFQARIGASGVVQRVVEKLRGETDGLKKQAAGLVRNLAWHNRTNQERITEAQAIPALIALLSSGSSSQRKHAAGAIANMMWNNPALQTQVAQANGILALADLTGRGDEKLQAQVTLAIRQFVFGETKKVQAAAPHVIPTFVRMLASGSSTAHQQQATWALANLACNAANKPEIVSAGGIQPFVDLLSTGSNSQKQYAASALANLASTTEHKSYILAAGGIPPLVELLNRGSDGQKKQAAWAIRNLAWSYVDGQREVADAGGVPALVHLINAGTEAQVEHAAAALANLSTAEVNQSVIGGAGGIEALVKLSKRGTDTQKQQAVWAMANLAMSSGNRATIIELGGVEVLQDLASTGTPGQQKAASAALARINDPTRYSYITSDAQAVFRPPSDGSEDSDYQRLLSHGALGPRANGLPDTRGSSQAPRELKFGRGLYRSIASVPEIVTRSSSQSDVMQKPTKGSPAYRLLPGARQSEDHTPQRLHLLPSVRETSAVNVEQDQFEWSAHDRDNLPPEHTPLRRIQSANPQVRVAYRMPPSPVEQTRSNRPMLHRPSTLGDLLDPYGGYSPAKNQILPHNVPRVKSDVDLIRSTTSSREDLENIPANIQHQLRAHNSVTDIHNAHPGLLSSSRGENSKSRVIDLGSLNEGVAQNELSRRNSIRPPSMDRFLESAPTQPPKLRGERSYHSQPSGFDSIGHEEVYEFDEDEDLSSSPVPKSKYPIISL